MKVRKGVEIMQFGDKFILMFETFDLDFEQPEMQAILNDEMCHCFGSISTWRPEHLSSF